MINATIPVYQSEISPAQNRGRLVSTHGIFLVSGYVSNFVLSFSDGEQATNRFCVKSQCRLGPAWGAILKAIQRCNGVSVSRFKVSCDLLYDLVKPQEVQPLTLSRSIWAASARTGFPLGPRITSVAGHEG